MKVVFMGTPEFALTALQKIAQKHDVVCVYTRAPQMAGRGKKLTKSPVHVWAEEHGIEVRTPKTLRTPEAQQAYRELKADIAVVAAYGLILPQPVIEAFPKGCINIHGSLLPRWRGAAPIQRAIEAGDHESGITIMNIVEGLDAGAMLLKGSVPITSNTTGESLHDALAEIGGDLILQVLADVDGYEAKAQEQDESLVTYAEKIDKSESKIDFSQSAETLERKIRAFNSYPAMYFEYDGERCKVLRAEVCDMTAPAGTIIEGQKALIIACGNKALSITKLQRSGKKKMPIAEVLKGFQFTKKAVD